MVNLTIDYNIEITYFEPVLHYLSTMTKPITQADIGPRIRQARERIGMSQKDLAQAVGRDQKAISEYESGTRKIYAVELAAFAQVLQVSVNFLIPVEVESSDLATRLLNEFHSLPTVEDKQDAISILRSLARIAFRRNS